jgi:hypothetical protein
MKGRITRDSCVVDQYVDRRDGFGDLCDAALASIEIRDIPFVCRDLGFIAEFLGVARAVLS